MTGSTKNIPGMDSSMKTVKPEAPTAQMAMSRASKLLQKINTADLATRELVEMIEAVFHIEDLFTLARANSFIALNFFELICNLDYVIFSPTEVMPVGTDTTGLIGAMDWIVGGSTYKFPLSLTGKLAAVAFCFKLQATKLDSMLTGDVLTAFMQGTGAAQIAQDAVNAMLKGGGGGALAGAAK